MTDTRVSSTGRCCRSASPSVVVVGASAAGLYTALLLAGRGLRVSVIDRAQRPEMPARSLIVTSRLRRWLGDLTEPALLNVIRRFELYTDGRVATIPLRQPDLVIERSTLLRQLMKQAASVGAEMLFSTRFRRLHPAASGVMLDVDRSGRADTIGARTVVAADGAFSQVARQAGWPPLTTVSLIQARVKLPHGLAPDTARVWFRPEQTPFFYWLIPESAGQGVLGIIGENGPQARCRLERFLDERGLEPIEFQAARTPSYRGWVLPSQRVGGGEVFVVGDAAGHVKLTTVGGVVTGLRGAAGVAETIATGRFSPELRRLRRELALHFLIHRSLRRFTQADYSLLLDLLGPRARHILATHTRDTAAAIMLRLCLTEPRLVLLGCRAFLTRASY